MKNKIKTNSNVSKKKTIVSKKGMWNDKYSLTKEEKDKCLIIFPEPEYAKDVIDGDLGLIGILVNNEIMFDDVYYKTNDGLIFKYDKKYTKKIKDIEYEYFMHNIQIDAKNMSDLTMFVVNWIGPQGWREKLISKYKRSKK